MKADERKVEAFKTWCLQRVSKICWTERVTNDKIHQGIRKERSIWATIEKKRKI